MTVATLAAQHSVVPEKTLLKVDTQGFERQVLDSAGDLVSSLGAVQLRALVRRAL